MILCEGKVVCPADCAAKEGKAPEKMQLSVERTDV
jgi:hypothetical protein